MKKKEQLAINIILDFRNLIPTAAKIPRFGLKNVTIIIRQQNIILIIKAIPPLLKDVIIRATPLLKNILLIV
jgi:hypothetical protein